MRKVMVDIETLGLRADSRIVSIGAVRYGSEFYTEIAQWRYSGFFVDGDTLAWWEKQGGLPNNAMKVDPSQAVRDFAAWLGDDFDEVWANGPQFDLAVLEHHFRVFGVRVPWRYDQVRDYRTVRELFKQRGKAPPTKEVSHNALQDARDQMEALDWMLDRWLV